MPIVQGRSTDSKEEYHYAVALNRLGYRYIYKYQIGITHIAGSVQVDFVVWDPFVTPIEIEGDYWHPNASGEVEVFRTAKIWQHFRRKPIVVNADRLPDIPSAIRVVREVHG